jgi:2-desacetyl-2-hydroxyethyl bacteriochlorophyllide A dehydrogenase
VRLALFFEAPCRVAVREEPLSPPAAGQVVVETRVSAISPGTEMLIYRGRVPQGMAVDAALPSLAGGFAFPLAYGYAAVGRVVELGDGVGPEWRDRLVFAFHPHASHFLAAPDELLPVPAGLAPEAAALLPNAETAVNFLMDGRPIVGERVVVFGQGVVGLLTTALLARIPLSNLVTVDRHPLRRQRSLDLGAHAALDADSPGALDPLRSSADLTYELSGSPAALEQAIAVTGFGGRVVIGSWYGDQRVSLDLGGAFHRSRIELVSSQVSTIAPRFSARWSKARRLEAAWRLLGELDAACLITHRFPITAAPEAYALLDRRPETAIQVLLSYAE